MGKQPTNQDLMDKIDNLTVLYKESVTLYKDSAVENQGYFMAIQQDISNLGERVGGLENKVASMDDRLTKVEKTLATQVVTKDYLDEKLNSFISKYLEPAKTVNSKVDILVNKLSRRKVLPTADVVEVLSIQPFPKIV
jgi:uncharacterized coiled-coil protein SlyX